MPFDLSFRCRAVYRKDLREIPVTSPESARSGLQAPRVSALLVRPPYVSSCLQPLGQPNYGVDRESDTGSRKLAKSRQLAPEVRHECDSQTFLFAQGSATSHGYRDPLSLEESDPWTYSEAGRPGVAWA
jgi:hypothetical protein